MALWMPEGLLAGAIGFLSGVLSGAFGIGGGMLTTPAIRLVLGAPALVAVGTPLLVIIPGAIAGALSYQRRGLVELSAGFWLGITGTVAAVLGALATELVGGSVVLVGTAVLMAAVATDMTFQAFRPPPARPTDASRGHGRIGSWRLAVIGLLAGGYAGFFGLGGGFVLVPLLVRWMRYPIKNAMGTSLVAVAVLAVPGAITHAALGHVDWNIGALMALGVVPGAVLGARFTASAREVTVRVGFALILAGAAVWLFASEIASMM